jgi:uncharacterized protein (TIGR00288 family)
MPDTERSLAVFIDFENLALGFLNRRDRFDIARVLERLVEKGKIVAKKAYADWSRFANYTAPLHESAIELVEIPRRAQTGKNSADIHLCVDAMDLAANKEHIDTFVIVSGDSDFSPLVSKLKENGKHVIGLGMAESTSELLRDNCDEFIYYDDLGKTMPMAAPLNKELPENKRKAFALLIDSLTALRRENKESLHSSMIKDTMKRKKPSFNESYHGYRSFSALLEDAQKEGLIEIETGKRSGTYVVTRFGEEMKSPMALAPSEERTRRRRRRRRPRSAEEGAPMTGEERGREPEVERAREPERPPRRLREPDPERAPEPERPPQRAREPEQERVQEPERPAPRTREPERAPRRVRESDDVPPDLTFPR